MYFITTISRNENEPKQVIDNQHLRFINNTKCLGYTTSLPTATALVDSNKFIDNIKPNACMWLVIEHIMPGINKKSNEEEVWYLWDCGLNHWVHAAKPGWSFKQHNWAFEQR